MKDRIFLFCITACMILFSCSKKDKSERFILLTTPVWTTESIVATGTDTTGIGVLIKQLEGDAKFNEDGSGSFGSFTGQWWFNPDETNITIKTQSLIVAIVADIIQITAQSLKLSTPVTLPTHPSDPINLLITFKAK